MIEGIDVWSMSLESAERDIAELCELLDPAEMDRAERFRHNRDRHRFVVARGTLRMLLGDYLAIAPGRVPIKALTDGKPVVAGSGLHFNLSHSADTVVFAFADRKVGIDVERVADDFDIGRVVAHFFSPEEIDDFESSSPLDRHEYFFRTWVRKEAYLKATGMGFAIDPASLIIGNPPSNRVMIRGESGRYESDDSFTVLDLNGFGGCVAALAVAGCAGGESISYRSVTEEARV